MSFLDDVVNTVGGAVSDVVNGAEDVVGGAASGAASLLGGPAGSIALGLLTGGASSLFTELPQLLGGMSGLLGQGAGAFGKIAAQPFPFGMPSTDPSQMFSSLSGVLNKINLVPSFPGSPSSSGIGGQLNNLDTGGISNQINGLMNQATQAAQNGDALTAQKDMIQAQVMFQTISQLMNTIGEMQKQAIQNSRLN